MMAANVPAGFQDSQVFGGLELPTAMSFGPDGTLFVAEKAGTVRIYKDGALLATPFLTVAPNTFSERGLTSIVVDPNYESNGFIYVGYTLGSPIVNRLSRFKVSNENPNVADPNSELVLLDNIAATTGLHNIGMLKFGSDGMLYVGVGEAGVPENAQNLSNLSGKILRLNVSNPSNLIPADNPFVNTPGVRPEIYAYGFRNPFSGAIDLASGTILVNDVGQATWEEVNQVLPGRNYGWPAAEGPSGNPAHENAIFSFNHNGQDAAVTGGVFYTGNQFPPEYQGSYFTTHYINGTIFRIERHDHHGQVEYHASEFGSGVPWTVDYDVAPDGSLWYLNVVAGTVSQIRYVGGANRLPVAVASASVTSGLSPLTVNFSGDGSTDPDNDDLTYSWNFGDGSPIVSGKNVSHTYTVNGNYEAVLTVNDGQGGVSTAAPLRIVVGDIAPTAQINLPSGGLRYEAGDTISFSGSGNDVQDGALPASALSWTIVFHHGTHTHPFLGPLNGIASGSFEIPIGGETATNVWYRVHLTVTDSAGLTNSTHVDIHPDVSSYVVTSNVFPVSVDGQPVSSPVPHDAVVGSKRTLSAPALQMGADGLYVFQSWSDGGASTHEVTIPDANVTYNAVYTKITANLSLYYRAQSTLVALLHRAPTAEELHDLVNRLDADFNPRHIVQGIWNSAEHMGLRVNELYAHFLGRAPAPNEFNEIRNLFLQGASEYDIKYRILTSEEYNGRVYRLADTDFISSLYQDLLGRAVDPNGLNHWVKEIPKVGRAQIVDTFLKSDEYYRVSINSYYNEYLGRAARSDEGAYYLNALKTNQISLRDVAELLISGSDFFDRAVRSHLTADEVSFVVAAYKDLVKRDVDPEGLAWAGLLLDLGTTREALVDSLWSSNEQLAIQVDRLYVRYLGRAADPNGRAYWTGRLASGLTAHELEVLFIESNEYANNHSSNAEFVKSMYTVVLGRASDPFGQQHWTAQLDAGMDRRTLIENFIGSAERFTQIIDAYYREYLRRLADAGGRQYFLGLLLDGSLAPWDLAQVMLASDEYFSKA